MNGLTSGSSRPVKSAAVERYPGDEVAVVAEGRVNRYLPDRDGWFETHARDGFFTRELDRHQYFNMSDQPATVVFGVAPKYR
jgi:hypothetical protein